MSRICILQDSTPAEHNFSIFEARISLPTHKNSTSPSQYLDFTLSPFKMGGPNLEVFKVSDPTHSPGPLRTTFALPSIPPLHFCEALTPTFPPPF